MNQITKNLIKARKIFLKKRDPVSFLSLGTAKTFQFLCALNPFWELSCSLHFLSFGKERNGRGE